MSTELMSFGEWVIRKDMELSSKERSFASHMCPPHLPKTADHIREYPFEYAWFLNDDDAQCYHCNTPVPEEVQTLVALLT